MFALPHMSFSVILHKSDHMYITENICYTIIYSVFTHSLRSLALNYTKLTFYFNLHTAPVAILAVAAVRLNCA